MKPLPILWSALLVLPCARASAQTGGGYDLRWNTFDGGGGASTGASYVLTGTAGQPDTGPLNGGAYAISDGFWWSGVSTVAVEPGPFVPGVFQLHPAYPNPARDALRFAVDLPADQRMRVDVLDVAGHRVRTLIDEVRPAGRHTVLWNARGEHDASLGAGVYFVRVIAGTHMATRKLVLLGSNGGSR